MNIQDLNTTETKFVVFGEEREVDPSAPVRRTVLEVFRELGITTTPVIVDGVEALDPNDLPETFEGHIIEIKKYMKAG